MIFAEMYQQNIVFGSLAVPSKHNMDKQHSCDSDYNYEADESAFVPLAGTVQLLAEHARHYTDLSVVLPKPQRMVPVDTIYGL